MSSQSTIVIILSDDNSGMFGVCIYLLYLQIAFQNQVGKFDLEVTTFQMAVLFAWNQRPLERISFEDLR